MSNDNLFSRAYQIMIGRINDKLSQDEPYYFETTKSAKHEAIALLPNDTIQIKRTNAPKIPEYYIDMEMLEAGFNHFRFRETITITQYDAFIKKALGRVPQHGPTYIAIIRVLQEISRGL
ncbi:MAG: hypothetical protein LHW60_07080 [Candidatus Cloacimonetes bacterium]|nr:hypothetical protein [Candidatus Cloacimonadota bacterium]